MKMMRLLILFEMLSENILFVTLKAWYNATELSGDVTIALCNQSNGSYVIKDFWTLPLIFSSSKYFR